MNIYTKKNNEKKTVSEEKQQSLMCLLIQLLCFQSSIKYFDINTKIIELNWFLV